MADFLNDVSTYPILRTRPYWNDSLNSEFVAFQKIDAFPGTIEERITTYSERPFTIDLPFIFFEKANEYTFLEFFHDQRGRWKKFWMPSPYSFFEVVEDIILGDDFIIVEDNKYRNSFRGFERLWIELKNGDWLVFKIQSVTVGPNNGQETINISTPFDRTILINDIVFCSFFYLGRFDFDRLRQENINDGISKINQKFYELIKEYP